jgi:hypothetical protein
LLSIALSALAAPAQRPVLSLGFLIASKLGLPTMPPMTALLSTSKGHEAALLKLKEDIEEQKVLHN